MTERCFYKCIEHTNSRQLSPSEIECADKCAVKFIRYNNKLMMNFVRRQNDIVSRRVKEAEQQMLENKGQEIPNQQEVTVSSS
ncbi:zf-Tim10 DDP domain containing protein [Asbolus verrucosus]|uniref:Mitochondrial import inner membrane translocase subunit n=1 Tax=Asbolus verrucosus TaxID=1661398 RepID=A0A482VX69_ASBVE|nr:zf-Tim10 DDP domain containing protein [Asbolus verrucosus]